MSTDAHTDRKWWIPAGIAGFALLVVIAGVLLGSRSSRGRSGEPRLGQRSPIARLSYCEPGDGGLCIVSFSQIVDGAMQVNVQVPHAYYPEFILVINRYGVETSYGCRRDEDLPTRVLCEGPPQAPGEVLQFKIISRLRGTILAEGKFSIVGIALSTPEILATGTLETLTGTVTVTPTGTPPRPTPSPVGTTPSPSYPNPSYP